MTRGDVTGQCWFLSSAGLAGSWGSRNGERWIFGDFAQKYKPIVFLREIPKHTEVCRIYVMRYARSVCESLLRFSPIVGRFRAPPGRKDYFAGVAVGFLLHLFI